MPKISVLTPFQFFHPDGAVERFAAGIHDVAEHVASHWYAKAHCDAEFVDDSAGDDKPKRPRGRPAKSPNGQEAAAPASDADTVTDEQTPAPAAEAEQAPAPAAEGDAQ